MQHKGAYLLVCAIATTGWASVPGPAIGFDGSKSGAPAQVPDFARDFKPDYDPPGSKEGCDGCQAKLHARQPGARTSATTREREDLLHGYAVPLPRLRDPAQCPLFLCVQYAIALEQCFMAVQGIEKETDRLALFQVCLRGQSFSSEPGVCRREAGTPDDP